LSESELRFFDLVRALHACTWWSKGVIK